MPGHGPAEVCIQAGAPGAWALILCTKRPQIQKPVEPRGLFGRKCQESADPASLPEQPFTEARNGLEMLPLQ